MARITFYIPRITILGLLFVKLRELNLLLNTMQQLAVNSENNSPFCVQRKDVITFVLKKSNKNMFTGIILQTFPFIMDTLGMLFIKQILTANF